MIKKIIAFSPLFIVMFITFKFYSKEENPLPGEASPALSVKQKAPKTNPDTQKSLIYSLKKINEFQNKEKGEVAKTSIEESTAIEDLNFIFERAQFIDKNSLDPERDAKVIGILQNAAKNPDLYGKVLNMRLEDALLSGEMERINHVLSLTISLDVKDAKMLKTTEDLIVDMAGNERPWDEGLFRSLLQFYYSGLAQDPNAQENFIKSTLDFCKDELTKSALMKVHNELSAQPMMGSEDEPQSP